LIADQVLSLISCQSSRADSAFVTSLIFMACS